MLTWRDRIPGGRRTDSSSPQPFLTITCPSPASPFFLPTPFLPVLYPLPSSAYLLPPSQLILLNCLFSWSTHPCALPYLPSTLPCGPLFFFSACLCPACTLPNLPIPSTIDTPIPIFYLFCFSAHVPHHTYYRLDRTGWMGQVGQDRTV